MLGFFGFYLDPMYLLLVLIPGMIIGGIASMRVKAAFQRGAQIPASSGYSGAQAAGAVLTAAGIRDVRIEQVNGFLSDHYSPTEKVLRLSPDVYHGRSLAALGVAAHEAGHAIQHAVGYTPLTLRNAVVPMAQIGSGASYFVIIGGLLMQLSGLVLLGILLFAGVLVFQLINLPCEFNASSRARQQLQALGLVRGEEDREVGKVLNAAALTYVAGVVTTLLTLAYYIMLYAGMSDRE